MSKESFEVGIIGGGIAGVSVAMFLAEKGIDCAIFEMESTLAYHTTGRSAALFTPYYGPDSIRAFAQVAKDFFLDTPYETEAPLTSEKGFLALADETQVDLVERPPGSEWWDESKCLNKVPILRKGKFLGAVYDPTVRDIDVHALHSLYVRIAKQQGSKVFRDAGITSISRLQNTWLLKTKEQEFEVGIVVNASGAWGDEVARLAKIKQMGLIPKRRTALTLNQSQFDDVDFSNWNFVAVEPDILYFQPFGKGTLMLSPSDETACPPCDVQPEELDIAICIDRFQDATTVQVKKIESSWAGLRTFAPDGDPVIGWAPDATNFFWLVGQGGYGVFTSPAIGQYAASLISGTEPSPKFQNVDYDFAKLNPDRYHTSLT